MKKLLFLLIVSLFIGCKTVPLSEPTAVIDLPGQTKQQIYEKSRQWITYTFVSGRAVMDYKDPFMGRIIGKGRVEIGVLFPNRYYAYYIATIDCVNNKARIIVKPIHCYATSPKYINEIECECTYGNLGDFVNNVNTNGEAWVNSYKKYMTQGQAPAWDGK